MLLAASKASVAPGLAIFLIGVSGYYLASSRDRGERPSWTGFRRFAFPGEQLRSPSFRIDLVFYVLTKLARHSALLTHIAVAVLVSHALGSALADRSNVAAVAPTVAVVALACLIAFVTRDLTHYLVHRLHHQLPVLWAFHKVHHAATYLTPLTTERTHPVEDQFFALAEGLAMGLALGVLRGRYAFTNVEVATIAATTIWVMRIVTLTPLQHSSAPIRFGWLDRVVYSPSLHQVHHSSKPEHWDRNFGECLSVWDSLFGTYHRHDSVTPRLGLPEGGHDRYQTLSACLLGPLAEAWRRLSPSWPSGPIRPAAPSAGQGPVLPPGH